MNHVNEKINKSIQIKYLILSVKAIRIEINKQGNKQITHKFNSNLAVLSCKAKS